MQGSVCDWQDNAVDASLLLTMTAMTTRNEMQAAAWWLNEVSMHVYLVRGTLDFVCIYVLSKTTYCATFHKHPTIERNK